jgi:hypothetical protein
MCFITASRRRAVSSSLKSWVSQAARNRQRVARDPTRLVRRQEHRDRRYIVRLPGPPERRQRDKLLLEIAADEARGMCALSF